MTPGPGGAAPGVARPAALRWALAACALLAVVGFIALGNWQVRRLAWKRALIARVDERVHAPAVAAPARARWAGVNAQADEYRHVAVEGVYLYGLTTRVQAATELGAGFWLLTPLCGADGAIVLVNRGFVAADAPAPAASASASTEVSKSAPVCQAGARDGARKVEGLLRISEPGGGFLRRNDPSGQRWYSRDVAAIAAARGLPGAAVAPYFIDAQAGQEAPPAANAAKTGHAEASPSGGLTVISFPNSHLVYALTWYALAALLAGACLWAARDERCRINAQTGEG